MQLLITILVTFFAGNGRRAWYRLCGDERSGGHQSGSDYVSWMDPIYGGAALALRSTCLPALFPLIPMEKIKIWYP